MCVQIIRAQPSDAPVLSAIAFAAKAHWGYPTQWLEQWRDQLTITPEFIAANETFMATVADRIVGFHALLRTQETTRLEHLWVLPNQMGKGIGRALFQHAVQQASARKAARLTIEADPHAEPFYLRMGGRRVRVAGSELDGERRELPLLEFDLT